jgi:hypothetical protein
MASHHLCHTGYKPDIPLALAPIREQQPGENAHETNPYC